MYYKKESPIHGVGVFAGNNIVKGQKIYDYIGIEMSWKL
jgi:SET domain-containing protein